MDIETAKANAKKVENIGYNIEHDLENLVLKVRYYDTTIQVYHYSEIAELSSKKPHGLTVRQSIFYTLSKSIL
jgi:hypothetical protein